MLISVILPASSDKIQQSPEISSCSAAALISSSMVCGIHSTIPCCLCSFGSHGWKGKTVHFCGRYLSVNGKRNMSFEITAIVGLDKAVISRTIKTKKKKEID